MSKRAIYKIDVPSLTFHEVSKLPSMHMQDVDYLEIGIDTVQYYEFDSHGFEGPAWFKIKGPKPVIAGQRNSLTGYRIMINWMSKLYKYKDQYYQVGGFTIV